MGRELGPSGALTDAQPCRFVTLWDYAERVRHSSQLADLASLVDKQARADISFRAHRYVSTGLADFDSQVGGLPVGLTILAAVPAMGSSCLATQIALHVATKRPTAAVAFFPVSGGAGELVSRLRAGFELRSAGCGGLWSGRLTQALELPQQRFFVDAGVARPVREIVEKARGWSRSLHFVHRLIVVDRIDGVPEISRNLRRAGHVAERLQELAFELGSPVLATAQLPTRILRKDPAPRLADMRCYGSLLDHVESVILLHRDEYYRGARSERPGEADLTVWSARSGEHHVQLRWSRSELRFGNY